MKAVRGSSYILFSFKFALTILRPSNFHVNFIICLPSATNKTKQKKNKTCWNFELYCIESIDQFGENWHLYNTVSSIHDYCIFLPLFSLLSSFSLMFYKPLESYTSFVTLIPRFLMLFKFYISLSSNFLSACQLLWERCVKIAHYYIDLCITHWSSVSYFPYFEAKLLPI